ncbi:hypothetical protein ABGN05_14660 [Aquibium sp. LZ166]|uniref:Phage tail tape measure protein n=1 Tax=Aquibium pacificus TaxID=3153579 RepID=A0ABV3SJF5_9HYPH
MANDDPKLVVRLEARLKDFERQLNKAQKVADKSMGHIEKRASGMSSKLSGIGKMAFAPFALAATAALAPVLSVTAALNGAKEALSEFDAIAKAAKAGGLDAEAYQAYAYAAELGGVATDQFAAALGTFAKASGLAAEGKGKMVGALKALNPELLKNLQTATSQEERLRLVADALDRETDASRKAAIASAAFGDAGIRMVEMLKGGSAALDETARTARKLGLIVDRELIASAETLNDEFSTATKIMDLQFKQALINLAPIMIGIAERAARLAGDIRGLIDSMRDLENQSSQSLSGGVTDVDRERLRIENEILDLKGKQAEISGATAEAERRLLDGSIKAKQEELAALTAKGATIESILANRKPLDPIPSGSPIPDVGGGGGGGSRNARAKAAIDEGKAVRELIAELERELELVGASDVELAVSNALRQAGANATEEQKQKIRELVEALHEQKAATEAASDAAQELSGVGKDVMGGFIRDLRAGKTGAEALANAIDKIADKLLDMALNTPFGGGVIIMKVAA